MKNLEDQLTKLKSDLDAVTASKTESDRLLESCQAEVQQLQQGLQAAASDKESVSLSLADQSAEVQRLTNELSQLSSEKTAAELCGSESQAENKKLQTQLEQVMIRCLLYFGFTFTHELWISVFLSSQASCRHDAKLFTGSVT